MAINFSLLIVASTPPRTCSKIRICIGAPDIVCVLSHYTISHGKHLQALPVAQGRCHTGKVAVLIIDMLLLCPYCEYKPACLYLLIKSFDYCVVCGMGSRVDD
jgi:hypothetical protein